MNRNKEVYAPFEKEHGYDSDCSLRDEKSRIGEAQIKKGPSSSKEDKFLRSKTQWKLCGRTVIEGSQAVKTVVTRSGHNLRLYNEAQTTKC